MTVVFPGNSHLVFGFFTAGVSFYTYKSIFKNILSQDVLDYFHYLLLIPHT